MQENQKHIDDRGTTLPDKNKRSSNIFFILILACWILLLYFYAGAAKSPG